MAKPSKSVTPPDRLERWKKLWNTPVKLDAAAAEAALEEFAEAFVPTHMHKRFAKTFGVPKAKFDNRFFVDGAVFHDWETKLSTLGAGGVSHVEATVLYASPDEVEGHWLRGEPRRTLRDGVVDDWQAACGIVRAGETTLYFFIQPKMRGCIVRIVQHD